MANREHVAILRQGVGRWNTCRVEEPEIRPDLADTFLLSTDLSGADLTGAEARQRNPRTHTELAGTSLPPLHVADLRS